jgi:hypothetical protein
MQLATALTNPPGIGLETPEKRHPARKKRREREAPAWKW